MEDVKYIKPHIFFSWLLISIVSIILYPTEIFIIVPVGITVSIVAYGRLDKSHLSNKRFNELIEIPDDWE